MAPRAQGWAGAAASGLLLGAAFLPGVPAVLAWVALVPLLAVLEQRVADGARVRAAFGSGYVAGAAFFLVGTHWIALLDDVALTIGWLKYLGWILGALYLAVFWGAAAALAAWLARRSGVAARWTFLPAMLVLEELRGSGDLGFPWFQPGYTQHALLPVLQLASLGSVTLVTSWVLAVNAAALAALRGRTPRTLVFAVLLVVLPLAWGALQLRGLGAASGPPVALVQGNIPGEKKWSGRHGPEILSTFLAMSDSVWRSRPGLVIWPETATGTYLRRDPAQSVQVASLAARLGAPVFMGFAHWTWSPLGKALPWNAAGAWQPDGSMSQVYAKRHLVPFGERVPFQRWIPALGSWDLGQAEWQPGERTVLFEGPDGIAYSPLICFESIFPDLARRDVRAGSRLLVNVTNDEWFGNGAALQQHAAMAPFRAVENHVPLLRCANTGLTCVVDAHGRVTATLPVFEPRVLVARLPQPAAPTPFTRFGDWPGVAALLAVLALAWPRRAR